MMNKKMDLLKLRRNNNQKVYYPQYDKPFILRTDATSNKLAGVLLQEQNGSEVPICFVSRVTKKYEITELEFASVVFFL